MSDDHDVSAEQKKLQINSKEQIVLFVQKTVDYALQHIDKISELEEYPAEERNERLQRLQAWKSYVEFQRHTLRELQAGKLDDWFC